MAASWTGDGCYGLTTKQEVVEKALMEFVQNRVGKEQTGGFRWEPANESLYASEETAGVLGQASGGTRWLSDFLRRADAVYGVIAQRVERRPRALSSRSVNESR